MTGYQIGGWCFAPVWIISFFSGMSSDNAAGLLVITLFWLLWGPIRTHVLGKDNDKVKYGERE